MGRLSGSQKAENERLIECVQMFKDCQDEEAFKQIVKSLDSFLMYLANRKFRIQGSNSDDIYQEGLLALSTKAIPDYRAEEGAFMAFAKLCIKRHIITLLKS